jgi:hypothetical protein
VGRAGLKAPSLGIVGGHGAVEVGGLGVVIRELSGSERYEESRSAPVSIPPPVLFSLGIPPANIPPNRGAAGTPPLTPLPPPPPVSLLLLPRFVDVDPGMRGARPAACFPEPGTAGAPLEGGPPGATEPLSNTAAERSLVTAFLSLVPFVMSPSKAP